MGRASSGRSTRRPIVIRPRTSSRGRSRIAPSAASSSAGAKPALAGSSSTLTWSRTGYAAAGPDLRRRAGRAARRGRPSRPTRSTRRPRAPGGPCSTGAARRGASARRAPRAPWPRPPGRGSRRAASARPRPRRAAARPATVFETATSVDRRPGRGRRARRRRRSARGRARGRRDSRSTSGLGSRHRSDRRPAAGARSLPAEEARDLEVVGVVGGRPLGRRRLADRSARPAARPRPPRPRRRGAGVVERRRRRPRRAGAASSSRKSRSRGAPDATVECP